MRDLRLAGIGFAGAVILWGCASRGGPAEWPGADRRGLRVPEPLWERIRTGSGYAGREIGFSEAEFAMIFKKDAGEKSFRHLAPGFLGMFDDVRKIPDRSGDLSDALVSAASLADRAAIAHGLFGRSVAAGGAGDPSPEAMEILSAQPGWEKVPEGFRDLAARILSISMASAPGLRAAAGEAFLEGALPCANLEELPAATLYDWATAAHHSFERDPRTIPPGSLDLLDAADHAALAREGLHVLVGVESAVRACRARVGANPGAPAGPDAVVVLATPLGPIRIGTAKDDFHPGDDFLVIDPGGNDHYAGRTAASTGFARPVSVAIDFAGNDHYDSGSAPASLACGFFGTGILMDLAGDDYYKTSGAGLGCGFFGTGVLLDEAGKDFYLTLDHWGEGAGVAGVGILADRAGDDAYQARYLSQGFGGTLGVGILLDTAGNDRYRATGWDGPQNPFKHHQALSLSQGFSIGRRPDMPKSRKENPPEAPPPENKPRPVAQRGLAGGFGVLIDGGGDDFYEAHVYSGGSGYWFGMGIFEDFAGNDSYVRGSYSAGSSPHYAIGVCVDRSGNDVYNAENDDSRTSFGHGRDIGMGVFIDGDGDDRYRLGPMCGGSVSIQAVGLFWDRRGDDRYDVIGKADHAGDYPYALGNASVSQTEARGSPESKKGLTGAGIFLDTGGRDAYRDVTPIDPLSSGNSRAEGPAQRGRNGAVWRDEMKEVIVGVGLDDEWYKPATKKEK